MPPPRPSTPHAAAQHALRLRHPARLSSSSSMNIHDVRDRQTSDVRQTSDAHHPLMLPPYWGGGIINNKEARK